MRKVMSANTWARLLSPLSRSLSYQPKNAIAFSNFKNTFLGAWSYEDANERYKLPTFTGTDFNWVHDYFGPMANRNHKTALQVVGPQGAKYYSFDQLLRRSAQVANFFRSLGLEEGDRVMYRLPSNHVAAKICTLAGTQSALVMVPSSTALSAQDIAYRIKHANINVIVTTQSELHKFVGLTNILFILIDGVPPNRPDCVDYNESLTFPESYKPLHANASTDPLFLIYNEQKEAVIYSHFKWSVASVVTMYWQGLQPNDIMADYNSPNDEIMSLQMLFSSWNAAATILTFEQPELQASQVLDALACHRATHLYAPSSRWRLISKHLQANAAATPGDAKQIKLPALKQALSAGPLHPDVHDRVLAILGVPVREGKFYAGSLLTASFPGQTDTADYPAPGNKLQIVDATGQNVAKGEGELAVVRDYQSGQTLPTDLRHSEHANSLHRTGIIAARDTGEGPIRVFGHKNNLFRQNGLLVALPAIEGELLKSADVSEVAIIPKPSSNQGNELIAFIVLTEGSNWSSLHMEERANKTLASKYRTEVILCNELPKTFSGNINREELKRRLLEQDEDVALKVTPYFSS